MIINKFLNLSKPWHFHLENGVNDSTSFIGSKLHAAGQILSIFSGTEIDTLNDRDHLSTILLNTEMQINT